MVGQYRLLRPVVGFVAATQQIVTIPVGTVLTLTIAVDNSPGIYTVKWDGTLVEVFRGDIEQNSSMISAASVSG
jgi:hypothetical protein